MPYFTPNFIVVYFLFFLVNTVFLFFFLFSFCQYSHMGGLKKGLGGDRTPTFLHIFLALNYLSCTLWTSIFFFLFLFSQQGEGGWVRVEGCPPRILPLNQRWEDFCFSFFLSKLMFFILFLVQNLGHLDLKRDCYLHPLFTSQTLLFLFLYFCSLNILTYLCVIYFSIFLIFRTQTYEF